MAPVCSATVTKQLHAYSNSYCFAQLEVVRVLIVGWVLQPAIMFLFITHLFCTFDSDMY